MQTTDVQLRGSLSRSIGTILALALAALAFAWAQPGSAQAATTCTWAGNPLEPTGWFTVSPGVTNLPAAGPLRFVATGDLAGEDPRCSGQMKWIGQVEAGSTCALASFSGSVKGLPGVTRFWGKGSLLVPSYLYDQAGNLVGIENAEIMTEENFAQTPDCTTAGGFTGPAGFSSTVVLFG
jgi:hypothetical protein